MNWKYELFNLILPLRVCSYGMNAVLIGKKHTLYFIHKHCLAYSIHIIAINLIKCNPGLNSWVTMTLQYTGTIHKDMHICLIAFQILTLYPNVWISLLLPQKTLSPTTLQFFFVFQFCKCYICSINNTWVTDEYRGVPLTSFRADFFRLPSFAVR